MRHVRSGNGSAAGRLQVTPNVRVPATKAALAGNTAFVSRDTIWTVVIRGDLVPVSHPPH